MMVCNWRKLVLWGLLLSALMVFIGQSALAESPHKFVTLSSRYNFKMTLEVLEKAVKANKLGLVSKASAQAGAKAIGVTIPGNQVWGLFAPPYAVRMLKASIEAGYEAPVRLYITEDGAGKVLVRYVKPSDLFAPYGKPALDGMARELDAKFQKITDTIR